MAVMVGLGAGCNAGSEIIIAGWDGAINQGVANSRPADYTSTDIAAIATLSATINGDVTNDWNVGKQGSDDTTFGTFVGARTNNGTYVGGANFAKVGSAYIDYTIKNNGSAAYVLDSFHFDVWRKTQGSGTPSLCILAGGGVTAGDLAVGSIPVLGTNLPPVGADYSDLDVSLTSLSDYMLSAGESVTFRIRINGIGITYIDNIALTGVVR